MKLATPGQMNQIDRTTISRVGIPGIVLMENAALRVVEEAVGIMGDPSGKDVVVFAGKGNNGGDAFAVARHLDNKGSKVSVYVLAEKGEISGDAATNLAVLGNMGVKVVELLKDSQLDQVRKETEAADLVVDGIFGTGLRGGVKGIPAMVIKLVNDSGRPVLSIDIPSGVSGETGKVLGICVEADVTVTFGLPKIGLAVHPGCDFAGRLVVADIGIPPAVIEELGIKANVTDEEYVLKRIPLRRKESNKGDYGKILIITGSTGMTGAGCLAGKAALRTGAGLVYLGVPAGLANVYDASLTEAVTLPLEDNGHGCLSAECAARILEKMGSMSAVAVGPGLTAGEDIFRIVEKIVEKSEVPLILDADALNALSRDVSILGKLKTRCVITPHPGEFSRLTGLEIRDIRDNRIEAAREFSGKWNVTTVLKGSRTVVATPDGDIYVNTTGNSGMATAGSGDVLTGIIAGLAAQGVELPGAAVTGVYLHGLAGDEAARIKGEHGLIAGDIVEEIPYVIKTRNCRNRILI